MYFQILIAQFTITYLLYIILAVVQHCAELKEGPDIHTKSLFIMSLRTLFINF